MYFFVAGEELIDSANIESESDVDSLIVMVWVMDWLRTAYYTTTIATVMTWPDLKCEQN